MIIDGKYVKYSEEGSAAIQKEINLTKEIQQDAKSNLRDPKEFLDEGRASSIEFGFSVFDNNELTADRAQRYGYYREMAQMEFIQRGLEIISDDSTLRNLENNVIKVQSDNETIRETLADLYIERLDLNTEMWSIVYETIKMGDSFYEIIPDSYENPTKIIHIRHLIPENISRIEINGRLMFYTYKTTEDRESNEYTLDNINTSEIIYKLQPWQIIHFRVKDDKDDAPYGTSLLKPGIRTYRRLSLLEDVILVYRISRAPERRVFYIDVGNMNYTDAKKFIQKMKSQYRTQNFLDEGGNINRKANVLSITSDIFVPRREGGTGTEIDTLQGGEALNEIKDLEYFKNKILRLMNIPPAYMGDEADRSQGNLSSQDYRFGRFIERVQTQVSRGIEKIAAIELYFQGYKKEDLGDFRIEFTPPSNIAEITDIDIMNQRMSLITTIKETGLFDNEWILKNILKLSNKEISDINLKKQAQRALNPEDEQGFGMGGYSPMGGMGPEVGMETTPGLEGEVGAPGVTPEAPGEPAGEAEVAAEEETKSKEEVITEALVEVLGKNFIIKESKDFFKMMKYIKEDRFNDEIPIMERASEIIRNPVKKVKKNKTERVYKNILLGEMGGLKYERGKNGKDNRVMSLFEHTNDNAEKTKVKTRILYKE